MGLEERESSHEECMEYRVWNIYYIIFQILMYLCWGMLYHIHHNQDYVICRIREQEGSHVEYVEYGIGNISVLTFYCLYV